MCGAVPPLPKYAFMAWYFFKAQGQLYPTFILPYNLCLDLPSCLLPSGFPTKILYEFLTSPMFATCPAHLVYVDFVILLIFGQNYKCKAPSYTIFSSPP
jgi:hypothetical protein